MIKIALIGMGNVGRSFLSLLKEKKNILKKEFDLDFSIIAIYEYDGALIKEEGINLDELFRNIETFRELPYWKKEVTPIEGIDKLTPNVCIETTPTNPETGEPALSHILKALNNKIDVIASNKGPFYLQYEEIMNLALKNKSIVKYEATVASCVPALSSKRSLIGNEIKSIRAILNGTSNYILSRMSSEGVPFSMALKEAQELGYAETDPTLDINGYDAAGKLVILANTFFNTSYSINDVKIKGITDITPQAIALASLDGYVIKHLAIAEEGKLLVEPRLLKKDSPLNISGTLNVIEIQTKYAGPMILMGRGAGGYEAASAIINDLINIKFERCSN
ncbi:MAG: homoserine dehydrogenase [Promethearchaeota archaeon]